MTKNHSLWGVTEHWDLLLSWVRNCAHAGTVYHSLHLYIAQNNIFLLMPVCGLTTDTVAHDVPTSPRKEPIMLLGNRIFICLCSLESSVISYCSHWWFFFSYSITDRLYVITVTDQLHVYPIIQLLSCRRKLQCTEEAHWGEQANSIEASTQWPCCCLARALNNLIPFGLFNMSTFSQ